MSAVTGATPFASARPDETARVATERRWMLAFLIAGFSALMIGATIGPLQALNYDGINAYPALQPVLKSYYQGLTLHGVLNAYVFTFFVTCGLLVYLPAHELGLHPNLLLWRSCFVLMAVGALMLVWSMADNSSSVLWTFYPPLKASAVFYLGMTLLSFGSVLPLPILLEMRADWKRRRPGELTPLVTYMSLVTMLMWGLASVGVVAELLLQLDPWSLGFTNTVDPMIGRTLFWLTGHPIVYFWLMPAYVSWYGLLSHQAGGKLVSDPMARLTFVLLFVFSLPVGTHHQFDDPGFSPIWRGILVALTMSVALPSLITAFTIGLSLEFAGRRRIRESERIRKSSGGGHNVRNRENGGGWFGWFVALPWGNPAVAAQVLAAITFIFGGATGVVQGSWQLDTLVHNTIFIPGHFHVTVGSVTAMTFMAVAFWMVPHLTGRALISRRLALISVWLWFIGMSVFALGMHWGGLYGVPRRAWISSLPPSEYHRLYGMAHVPLSLVAIGGVVLWLATFCFYAVFFGTLLFGRRQATREPIPFAQTFGGRETYALEPPGTEHTAPVGIVAAPQHSRLAAILEHLGLITALTAVITVAAYIPILWPFLNHITRAPGWVVW